MQNKEREKNSASHIVRMVSAIFRTATQLCVALAFFARRGWRHHEPQNAREVPWNVP
jgi:hypothetical protein